MEIGSDRWMEAKGIMRFLNVFFALLGLLAVPAEVQARLKAEDFQTVLSQAKIFSADSKIQTSLSGTELSVSTYRAASASEESCKADAVLAARSAFSADPELSRLTLILYDPRGTKEYFEIPVTVGDVTAFASGHITKEQLFSAIKLERKGVELRPLCTQSQPSGGVESSLTTPSVTAFVDSVPGQAGGAAHKPQPKPVSPRGFNTYSAYGVAFDYPSTWMAEYPRVNQVVVQLFARYRHGQPTIFEMSVFPAARMNSAKVMTGDPRDYFLDGWETAYALSLNEDDRKLVLAEMKLRLLQKKKGLNPFDSRRALTSMARVAIPDRVVVGAGKNVSALQKSYWAQVNMDGLQLPIPIELPTPARTYLRYVVIPTKDYTVQLSMICPEPDAGHAARDFETLLSSIKVSGAVLGGLPKKK